MSEQLSFWAIARNHPNELALVEDDGNEITFGELAKRANQLVRGLRSLGLKRGDCIAVISGSTTRRNSLALGKVVLIASWRSNELVILRSIASR